MRSSSNLFYRFRGQILGLMALALILIPGSKINDGQWLVLLPFAKATTKFILVWNGLSSFIFLLAILLRIRSRQFIGEHTRGSRHEASTLVTAGPYAHMRHPLYLSNTLVAISLILFHLGPSLLVLPFMATVLIFEIALAHAEDRFLENLFGSDWFDWKARTPMWPVNPIRFLRNFRKGKWRPGKSLPNRTFFKAFCADASTWMWLLFCILILLLLKVQWT